MISPENYPEDNEICGSPKYTIIDTSDLNKAYNIIVKEVICVGGASKYDYCKATPKVLPINYKRIKYADYCHDNGGSCYITFKYNNKDSFDIGYS